MDKTRIEETAAEWAAFKNEQGTTQAFINSCFNAPPPVPTGITSLDRALSGGLRPGLNVLGGEPGAGKSALGLQIITNLALTGERVGFASLEMSLEQCMLRVLSSLSMQPDIQSKGVAAFSWSDSHKLFEDAHAIIDEKLNRDPKANAMEELLAIGNPIACAAVLLELEYPGLNIAAGPEIRTLSGLESFALRGQALGMCLLVVDYLQLLSDPELSARTEYERITALASELRDLANDLHIPILALSSMNRQSDPKRPSMHCYKGSGGVEYDAECAMVISAESDVLLPGNKRAIELHITKHRWGAPTGEKPVLLSFDGAHNLIEERDGSGHSGRIV